MKFFQVFLAGLLAFVVGCFVMTILWIVMLVGILGSFSTESVVAVEPGSILKIDISQTITDSPVSNPLQGFDFTTMQPESHLSLFSALTAIDAAASDDRIDGIYLYLNGNGSCSIAAAEELRHAIEEFRQSGKFVVAYNEIYSQGRYYLSSVADKVYLQPNGMFSWYGLSSNIMFYKGLLDKLDVKVDVFRPTACRYKSAVEPYIMRRMSPENRVQMQQMVNSIWSVIADGVSRSRGIPVQELNRIADRLDATLPEQALECGLVDGLIYEDQIKDVLAGLGAQTDLKGDYRFVSLADYAAQLTPDMKSLSKPQVAILYADGDIVDGEGPGDAVYGNSLAKKIAELRADQKVKAVVLRVNSPGGSALASDMIWREMELLRAEKPVIVSMGSYAASGGYYISAPADAILADRTTLTGSIGVFGLMFDVADALQSKLGITFDGVKTNDQADMGFPNPVSPLQRAVVMREVDKVYATFTELVARGRNLPIEKVLDIAQGRVWAGGDALSIGLVDALGGLKAAIAVAADKAELGDDYRITEVTETPDGLLAAMITLFDARVRSMVGSAPASEAMQDYAEIMEALRRQGVQMYCPYRIDLR